MSRSIHQTFKQVFYKKSKREILEMYDENNLDIDVIELHKKLKIKRETPEKRKINKLLERQNKILENNNLLCNNIIGKIIVEINNMHDYIQIKFNDNSILDLYNKTKINGEKEVFLNKTVEDFILTENSLRIYLNDEISIEMNMEDIDYEGPKIFEYHNNFIIVGKKRANGI
jgi:hypothetical protein